VGVCDRGDDGEAESRARRGTGPVGAAEALEGLGDERGRESSAVVAHSQLEGFVVGDRFESYRACAVAERILDQGEEE